MHVIAVARSGSDLEPLTAALLERAVKLHTLRGYRLGPARRQGLVFGLGTVDLPEIALGLSALRSAFVRRR
jgi:GntR family transcriptional regulator / MocR family aminotransferase